MLTAALLLSFPAAAAADQTNPAVRAVATAASDVVVVEVLATAPRNAIEGARDTVRLKVVRGLKGSLAAGHEFGVYYHLLWADPRKMVNEAPKFEKGKTYIVFLTSSVEDVDGKRRVVRSLADQWFAVFPENEALEKELTRLLPKPTSGDH